MKAILNTLAKQIRGVSYKPENVLSSSTGNGVPLLRANNIRNNLVNFDELVFIDKKCVKEDQYLQKGDILVCTSSGSRMLVGKSAYIDKNYPYVFGAFCRVIRPQHVNHKFLAYYFQSPSYYHQISQFIAGANINNIRSSDIDQMIIDVPDISQQEKIVVKFDKIFKLISLRHKQLMLYDELIKSRFVEMFGTALDAISNAQNIISDVAKVQVGIVIKPTRFYAVGREGVKAFRSLNVLPFHVNEDSDWVYFSKSGMEQSKRTIVHENDILVVRSGNPGTACVVSKDYDGCNVIDLIIVHPDKSKILPQYLCAYLNFDHGMIQINGQSHGVAQKHFNVSMCENLKVLVPSLQKQNEFVDFLDQVDKSKLAVQASMDKLKLLRKSLMQQYFK